eukprot:TRINITY_DN1189_c0_g1_i1.p1 TRINITY_DN1189_c0_g1~~TRINITY_DN1189_c0_g1_i1.p1  ORF type:complete len:821 (+),score=150.65 TRINITY_DN1189_c0_g1_i1:20-2482(+)
MSSVRMSASVIGSAAPTVPPLTPATIRNLGDKLYEKRKLGALEVEQLIKEAKEANDADKIANILAYLTNNFAYSPSGNQRKGGLIALAASAIGLSSETWRYINKLVPPVLKCFTDQDSRVRYYACESMYNIAKVARAKILAYFNQIFDGLCRLSADPDLNVKNGAQLLDRLLKDIITESDSFDIEHFIPLLKERIKVQNAFVRQFLIGWITVLDSVPDIDLLDSLPEFLDGLFRMLSDTAPDIKREADNVLCEFLKEIRTAPHVEYGPMVAILIPFCSSKDEFMQLTALRWINEFIISGNEQLLPFSAQLLGAFLPCIAHSVRAIGEEALKANSSLLQLLHDTNKEFAISEFLDTITQQFLNRSVLTRLAALHWVLILHEKTPSKLIAFLDSLYPPLLKTLSDSADEVVRLDLEVLARLSSNDTYFDKLMNNLIHLFATDNHLLETRGCLIIRQLSLHINPEKIYRTLAEVLIDEEDPDFAGVMIQTLNIILLTSTELFDLRQHLKELETPESRDLFTVLYRSWSHSAVATFSLCLLAQAYEHATDLVFTFADVEITLSLLMEVDKLIQLLESPIFIYLRLQLLEPEQYPYLYKCLYGLLMLLPQSGAFETLKNRLNLVLNPNLRLAPSKRFADKPVGNRSDIEWSKLLAHFAQVQQRHQEHRRALHRDQNMESTRMNESSGIQEKNRDRGSRRKKRRPGHASSLTTLPDQQSTSFTPPTPSTPTTPTVSTSTIPASWSSSVTAYGRTRSITSEHRMSSSLAALYQQQASTTNTSTTPTTLSPGPDTNSHLHTEPSLQPQPQQQQQQQQPPADFTKLRHS